MALRWTQQELKAALDRVGPTKRYKDPQRSNKYGAKKVQIDNLVFDSKREAARYTQLKAMQQAGLIRGLSVHQPFDLDVNKHFICKYVADFVYHTDQGVVVEDVKSPATRTAVYQIKKKLMEAIYNIRILET